MPTIAPEHRDTLSPAQTIKRASGLPTPDSASLWTMLEKAANRIAPDAFDEYFALKRLLASTDPEDQLAFQERFAAHYRLRIGGLTDEFKRRYFELLRTCAPIGQEDPHTRLLLDLYGFKTRQHKNTIQASFVSKLVAIKDESRPIFDRHVSHFFGLSVPSVGTPEFRVAGFVLNLRRIQEQYEEWGSDRRFLDIETVLFRKQPKLRDCHRSRLCDFLVWTVGEKKL
jgi:hypothetical protein